jgi:hyaluronoglucosaminidase
MRFAVSAVLLAVACAAADEAAAAAAAAVTAPYGFGAYCNYPAAGCNATFGLFACDRTVTGAMTLGWAFVRRGKVYNGGVPQAGNLSYHLWYVRRRVAVRVPDAAFSGNVVIDFEEWRPVWEAGDAPLPVYRNLSEELVRKQHPGIAGNATAVTEMARAQFAAAALGWFVATIRLVREMRPLARVGYFGFPRLHFSGGAHQAAYNDKLKPLWAASSALYPEVYGAPCPKAWPAVCRDGDAPWRAELAHGFRRVVAEARRLSAAYTPAGVPILPFSWALLDGHTQAASVAEVWGLIEAVWQPPAVTQIVQWGYDTAANNAAMCNTTGPVLRQAIDASRACSAARCSGNGWCSAIGPATVLNATCVCGPRWGGRNCSTRVASG